MHTLSTNYRVSCFCSVESDLIPVSCQPMSRGVHLQPHIQPHLCTRHKPRFTRCAGEYLYNKIRNYLSRNQNSKPGGDTWESVLVQSESDGPNISIWHVPSICKHWNQITIYTVVTRLMRENKIQIPQAQEGGKKTKINVINSWFIQIPTTSTIYTHVSITGLWRVAARCPTTSLPHAAEQSSCLWSAQQFCWFPTEVKGVDAWTVASVSH